MVTDEPTVEDCPQTNGIPMLGLGTWKNNDPETCATSVSDALAMGYRHIDTAQAYSNEQAVGTGIARADVDREEVFVATKVWVDNLAYDDVLETTNDSLRRLGLESVDLLYVHWPARTYDPESTLAAFNELYEQGKIDQIGVSNFEPDQLRTVIEISEAPIVANQIECHPLFKQPELREVSADLDIALVAYSPLARGGVFDVPEIKEIAGSHGVSPAAVSLAWLRQRGLVAIPKATTSAHIRDNWLSLSLTLHDDELNRIDALDDADRCVDPEFGPWN